MKLINGDELKKKFRELIPNSSYANQINITAQTLCDIIDEHPASPAELAALELGYYLRWQKLKEEIRKIKCNTYFGETLATIDAIKKDTADLETRHGEDEVNEILVKAEAWELFEKKTAKLLADKMEDWPEKVRDSMRLQAKTNKKLIKILMEKAHAELKGEDK